jgi:hypothetical protein
MAEDRLEGDGRSRVRYRATGVLRDEMGTNTSLHPLYAWSIRGERAHCFVPRNRGPNTTLLASMTA